MCPYASTLGDVILYNATSDEYYCAPRAQFLADGPGSSTGVWVPALQPPEQSCGSAQECYDACFHCDGSPRYQATVPSATRLGERQYRANNGTCGGSWCFLGDLHSEPVPFEQACREYIDKAGPADHPSIISAAWPFRPVLSVPYIIQLSAAGLAANPSQSIAGLYDTARVLLNFQ
ncbi:hypothetical protein OEZ86_003605 [Tetradesmus obliquus]|nr:hypothetical protein OEZ86_003605 [Tetradesmus obliquus]